MVIVSVLEHKFPVLVIWWAVLFSGLDRLFAVLGLGFPDCALGMVGFYFCFGVGFWMGVILLRICLFELCCFACL